MVFINAAILSAAFCREINVISSIPPGEVLCPGREVVFTCVTRGSEFIAWMSDDYIGGGRQLEFSTANEIGAKSRRSNALATLVIKTNNGGTTVLESQQRFNVTAVLLILL